MGKSRLEQCQSTKEFKYETILRPLCRNSSELLLFEFTGFLGHVLIYSSARSCWFSVIFDLYGFLGFLSSSIMRISGALQSCLSLRRWTTLAMPGWQATRRAPWTGTPTRAGMMTSSWWNSMPRVSTCGRASAVMVAMTLLRLFRRTGCDFVFEFFHGGKTWKNFRSSCEVHVLSQVEWHHSVRINIYLCAFKKGDVFCFENWKKHEFDRCTFLSKSLTFTQVGCTWYMVQYIYKILSDI